MRLVAFGLTVLPLMTPAQEQEPTVRVTIVVDSAGETTIHERYRLPRDTSRIVLELLDRPCTTVRHVTLSNYRDAVALAVTRTGPWRIFRDSTGLAYNVDSSGFDLIYESTVHGAGDIPVMHLARPLPRREGERQAQVALAVTFRRDSRSEVQFPPLTHTASGMWTSRLAAMPSFVRVGPADAAAPRASECAEAGEGSAWDGGLTWRFCLLVGIMVVWVPLYLAWARRTRDDDA